MPESKTVFMKQIGDFYKFVLYRIILHNSTILGCPRAPVVPSKMNAILTDNCNSDDPVNQWVVPVDGEDAEIVIDLGCKSTISMLRMRNIKKKHGGTKKFTIFVSESLEGPWNPILTDQFSKQEDYGCPPLHTFEIK